MRKPPLLTLALICMITLAGCESDARMSEHGFRLPDGDAEAGRETFVYMQCTQCHSIKGEKFEEFPGMDPPYVELGGTVTQVKTYGQLVTAIINPSHQLARGYAEEVVSENGESNMYNYNRHMTVQELTDLVMYLQPTYDVVVPKYQYRVYPTT
ncbi:MAG: c-type cytochrome [Gammaproteobacteria bacterium]|nr:c-type cytochrome [Gammaproteobacteria bacterium]